ncbi:MAG: hypothetical protein RIR18_29 [Pseudomonadota bacterium]|jgi:transcriptional regulator with XRE-family HTH domain
MGDTADVRRQLGKRLGLKIAERRKALEWTQDELAEQLGVDAETVSRFERGVTVPALVTLDRLATVLKSNVGNLLSEVSITPTDQANRISAWLGRLQSEDAEFVVTQIQMLCERLELARSGRDS